jgi:L-alanine-DL-glutamate epimerase-like enolase superfamily enzyme
MKISDIQTAVIEANYDWTIVKVITDEDIIGYGECFFAPGLTKVIHELKPLLIGEDGRDIDRLCRLLREAGTTSGSGTGGIILHAIAGIETALWDAYAKWLDVPLFRLFGGAFRKRIRIYADCHAGEGLASLSSICTPRIPWWMSRSGETENFYEIHFRAHGGLKEEAQEPVNLQAYAERAKKVKGMGYTALKFDADIPNAYMRDEFNRCLDKLEIDLIASVVEAVRKAVGDDVDIAIDCHWRFSPESAIRLAEAVYPFNLLWLEDPTPPDSIDALAQVTCRSPVPIATGENHYTRQQFYDLIVRGGIQIAAPDFQKTGLLEGKRIADLAETFAIPVAPHNISSPIGTMASAHLCATIPNFLALEHHGIDVPFWEELALGWNGPIIRDGYIELDEEKPGIGIELNEDAAYRYRRKDEPFFDRLV